MYNTMKWKIKALLVVAEPFSWVSVIIYAWCFTTYVVGAIPFYGFAMS